jgi:hypothetical protein
MFSEFPADPAFAEWRLLAWEQVMPQFLDSTLAQHDFPQPCEHVSTIFRANIHLTKQLARVRRFWELQKTIPWTELVLRPSENDSLYMISGGLTITMPRVRSDSTTASTRGFGPSRLRRTCQFSTLRSRTYLDRRLVGFRVRLERGGALWLRACKPPRL